MLIVLDTNVLVSSQMKKMGNEATILDYYRNGWLQIAATEAIFEEYERVFCYPHIQTVLHWTPEHLKRFFANLRKTLIFVQPEVQDPVSDDPYDDKFFHCAMASQAHFLVSGDKLHVLSIPQYGVTKTISPKDFLEQVKSIEKKVA